MIEKKLANPESKYRGTPFWSWNEDLRPDILREQIQQMKKVGLGGAFMHARGGLTTEYMGKMWFDCIKSCIDEGEKLDMNMWAYDENGWPSGYAGGIVCDLGEKYHLRYITVSNEPEQGVIACYGVSDNKARYLGKTADAARSDEQVYYIIEHTNPYYVDILDPKVVKAFIDSTYERYKSELGDDLKNKMPGFFTDEPQYARLGVPYSLCLPEAFEKKYGYDIFENMVSLFSDVENYREYRYDFYSLVSELYTVSYAKQIYDWCEDNGVKFTGHEMAEYSLQSQMTFNAGVMPMYEYMHIPGMDWLRRSISSPVIPKQVSSVACQLGKDLVLSETFAMCGWDVSWQELKWVAEWQYVNGINFMCQHLQSYTIKGCRKRDYPPSMFTQSPWWDDYKIFNDYFARLGKILADGVQSPEVLVIHPMHTGWTEYCSRADGAAILKANRKFEDCVIELSNLHIDYHLGDETIMSRHGSVDGDRLKVGKCSYSTVIIPGCITLDQSTFDLLDKFVSNGGTVLQYGTEAPNRINGRTDDRICRLAESFTVVPACSPMNIDIYRKLGLTDISIIGPDGECGDIRCCKRVLDGCDVHFLANQNRIRAYDVKVRFPYSRHAVIYDAVENKTLPAYRSGDWIILHFEPMQSYILAVEDKENAAPTAEPFDKTYIALGCDWTAQPYAPNALTLDTAQYRTDGDYSEQTPVLQIMDILLKNRTVGDIGLKYTFVIDPMIDISQLKNIKLAHEYEGLDIICNGRSVENTHDGYYIDRKIVTVDITKYLVSGVNTVEFKGEFYQKDEVYQVLFSDNVHESMINKLTYDTEIESIYIIGDFYVRSLPFTYGERRAMFTPGGFSITTPSYDIKGGNITENGFAFYSGKMMLSQTVTCKKGDGRYFIKLKNPACALCKLYVNGQFVKTMPWDDFEAEVTDFITDGENTVGVELVISNRNLLGPHHNRRGEIYDVAPTSFSRDYVSDSYCFAAEGLL